MGLSIPGFGLQGDASGIAPQYATQLPSAESHLAAHTGEVDHGRQTWRTIFWGLEIGIFQGDHEGLSSDLVLRLLLDSISSSNMLQRVAPAGVQQGTSSSPQGGLEGSHWKDQKLWKEMENHASLKLMEHQREAIDRNPTARSHSWSFQELGSFSQVSMFQEFFPCMSHVPVVLDFYRLFRALIAYKGRLDTHT